MRQKVVRCLVCPDVSLRAIRRLAIGSVYVDVRWRNEGGRGVALSPKKVRAFGEALIEMADEHEARGRK
jgi:hypothetical protein